MGETASLPVRLLGADYPAWTGSSQAELFQFEKCLDQHGHPLSD